jgi:hypothetical protein
MRRCVRWVPSAVATAALLLAGCTGADGSADDGGIEPIEVEDDEAAPESEPEPDAESDPEPESGGESEPEQAASDATESDDPFAFDDPSEIDADYVDRVMAELLAVEAAVLNDVLESDLSEGLTAADSSRLRSVLAGPRLVSSASQMQQYATDEGIRSVFLPRDERTGLAWTTQQIIGASAECLVAIGTNDVSGVAVEPFPADESSVVVLTLMTDTERAEREEFNPTPWRAHDLQRLVYADSQAAVPQDEWAGLDFAAFLDIPCELPP